MKVYMEIICDEDVADELLSYSAHSADRVDVIRYDNNKDVIVEMGGEKYREGEER